jgi:CheY-like chemotaxis protein
VKVRPENRASKRLLLAEDDPKLQAVLTRVLRGAGYDVIAVADGAEAEHAGGGRRVRPRRH